MILNKNGKLAQLYAWFYNQYKWEYHDDYTRKQIPNPPKSLCAFFWTTLIAAVLFPITWISYPFKRINCIVRFFLSLFLWALLTGVGFVVGALLNADAADLWAVFTAVFAVLAGLLAVVVIALFIIAVTVLLPSAIIEVRNSVVKWETYREVTSVIRTKKESFFENYCPKIEWK